VHTYGVNAGQISLQTMVDACSAQPAQIFGLYPRKGTIQVGSDADLVVYDPAYRGVFSQGTSHSRADYSAYEGWERIGRPAIVTVRGEIQAFDGEFVGTMGRGVFLEREPTH
jgi:dihydropyrimidinase